jgi:hypothetical protein
MTLPASTPDPQRARPEGQFVRRLTPAVIRLAPWDDEQPRIGTERCKAVMIVCGGDIDWRARQDSNLWPLPSEDKGQVFASIFSEFP